MVGSDINYNKKRLNQLIELISSFQVEKIVILYKDRLLRFEFELIENLCSQFNTTIEIIDNTEKTEEQELVKDLIQIVTVFSCRLQGKRTNKAKKMIIINIDNVRTDYNHKVTTEIVKTKPSRIVMESLNVKGIMKNRHLSKAIAQQGLFNFKTMIQYKSKKIGTEFVEADKWYPSSKTCSECGYLKIKLSLSEREFRCECCGTVIDRDLNASINLSRYKAS